MSQGPSGPSRSRRAHGHHGTGPPCDQLHTLQGEKEQHRYLAFQEAAFRREVQRWAENYLKMGSKNFFNHKRIPPHEAARADSEEARFGWVACVIFTSAVDKTQWSSRELSWGLSPTPQTCRHRSRLTDSGLQVSLGREGEISPTFCFTSIHPGCVKPQSSLLLAFVVLNRADFHLRV